MGIKPIADLTVAQQKECNEIDQICAGLRQILADAQTAYAVAQFNYDTAMDNCRKINEPALIAARATFADIRNKCQVELTAREEALRAIRKIELD